MSLAFTVGAWTFDDVAVQRLVFATLISGAGGLGVALIPVGEKSWSWLGFAKLILLGALVGPPTAIALTDPRLAFLGEFKPWALFGVGMLAYPILVSIQRGGPSRFFALLLRLRPAAEPPPPPKET